MGSELTASVIATPATGAHVLVTSAVVITDVPMCNVATSPLVRMGKLESDSDVLALETEQNAVKNRSLGPLLQYIYAHV